MSVIFRNAIPNSDGRLWCKNTSFEEVARKKGWLAHLPDFSPPYKTLGKVVHRPWFSPDEYEQLYTATRERVRNSQPHYKWNAEQLHDYVLFLANTGLRPDEATTERRDRERERRSGQRRRQQVSPPHKCARLH
ncbi:MULTISPECIES: hypothetical protein [unclassified Bradyrhizobium]|uniref:hypothetical protein n=1 Tax=unclassified Bradyrhizobium TaxID=2631580 RepID=UPI0023AF1056|nr:hypothetical protein [Bradyrhizobium sp. CSS354]